MDRFALPFEPQEIGECGDCSATLYDGQEYAEYQNRILCEDCEEKATDLEKKEDDVHLFIEQYVKEHGDTPEASEVLDHCELWSDHLQMVESVLKQYDVA
ncbi:hypothetical protein ACFFJY_09085 [Fictibacillus aquaticus]|uniref:Uncharacterized protein n=1 Tax=Fictibacillus aquaticus TaxID=2021314 RepID=A0A235FBW5_9BACL|nr:hypothetical protein [Fictibacillus aquaticus]OYD58437.1 hypothetical protein CGZ90_00605 [Fictibacillus aquaticus]